MPKLYSIFEPQSANEKLAPRKRTEISVTPRNITITMTVELNKEMLPICDCKHGQFNYQEMPKYGHRHNVGICFLVSFNGNVYIIFQPN